MYTALDEAAEPYLDQLGSYESHIPHMHTLHSIHMYTLHICIHDANNIKT